MQSSVVVDSACTDVNDIHDDHPCAHAGVTTSRAEQKHGKHDSGAPLSSFPLLLVVVLAEHGGCLSSVGRDRDRANLERARSSSTRV